MVMKPEDLAGIRAIVTEFRDGMLEGRPSARMCFAICAPLQGFLSFSGYQTELVEGAIADSNHYWLALAGERSPEFSDWIIDPTADQFSTDERPMPSVYIGPRPYWYLLNVANQ